MSQGNVEIVRRSWQALAVDGLDALAEFFDQEPVGYRVRNGYAAITSLSLRRARERRDDHLLAD